MVYKDIDENEKGLVIGDIVKVKVGKYMGIRGQIMEIKDCVAMIKVPTYYGNKEPIILYKDVNFLKPLRKGKR